MKTTPKPIHTHWRHGQSDVLSTVILIAVIMVVSAIFIVFSMVQFGNEVSQSSIEYIASFLINVADDIDTFMFVPGAILTYQLPNTNYGTYNFVNSLCNVSINAASNKVINEVSGGLVYGVPPTYFSLPPGFSTVWRGSTFNGIPASSLNDFSLIVSYQTHVLMGTSMAVLQFGYDSLNGAGYGTYLVMVPRVMVINGTGPSGIGYVYIPVLNLVSNQGRGKLIISIQNISSQSIVLKNGGALEISEVCYFGNGVKPISSSAVVVGNTVYVTIVQIGVGFG
ncbi:hypothetical protein [Vulcanisaeta souniana]|uniref:Uncharacterized protein n=1 Tax=Vulcanisaeta souniana JCM 11219 TaxID=1293586 RepID=A0A830E3H5_9CREN|nr:hypothetical protein [Vulcanisaeta souniana]BDR93302.1 hypothetical protein Vsou_23950 [Vulcanisaeta souniana JCM 11219]GGI79057.1 hypothetical protein GCM10007112_15020 [Vulcanisaeta souniana JCM 11219]